MPRVRPVTGRRSVACAVDRPGSQPSEREWPNVAPGTGATQCQAPSRAEAAVAAMTSASACASSIVELRCSPPPTATRNFLASMTFRSS